jgi:hypothetical protein
MLGGLDFQDDRLADMLDHLALDSAQEQLAWHHAETDLNRHPVRVYDLETDFFRIDTSTANA